MRFLVVLGSTGSIGCQALEVAQLHPGHLRVVGLAAGSDWERLCAQARIFRPEVVSISDVTLASRVREALADTPTQVLAGEEGLRVVATWPAADTVLVATSGLAGLIPTLEALRAGKRVALANKETLVAAGHLVREAAEKAELLPVDSEHAAIHQCLRGEDPRAVVRVVLTCSGGPFHELSASALEGVTPEQALRHPVWRMGPKVTVDSATLMNKGLEVIEAHHLFGLEWDRIGVTVHPEGLVHALVQMRDGAVLAQLGLPDMRLPLAYALLYPERSLTTIAALDLLGEWRLTFRPPRRDAFPCLQYAYEAGRIGGTMPAVLSAADEVAVERFLRREISFPGIARVVRRVMEEHQPGPARSLEEILAADAWARRRARALAAE